MNKDLHDIDDLFKNSIEGHAEEVPPDVWDNIDHNLDKKQAAFYKRRYFTVRAAAILLLLIGGATIAAILHFHNSGSKIGKDHANEVGISTNMNEHGEKETTVQNQSANSVNKEAEPDAQTVVDLNKDDFKNYKEGETRRRAAVEKGNSHGFQSKENSSYSAERDSEVSIIDLNKANHIRTENTYPSIPKAPINNRVSEQPNTKQQVVVNETAVNMQTEMKTTLKTTYINTGLFRITSNEFKNEFPHVSLNSSILHFIKTDASLAGQNKLRVKDNFGWSVSPMIAWNVNLNTLKDDDHFRDPRNNSREAKRTEQDPKSYTLGVGVQKQFSTNFLMQSGIQYFSSETPINPKMIFAEPDSRGEIRYRFNCSSGQSYIPTKNAVAPVIGDSIKTNSSKSSLSYLQVPLLASYKIDLGKFSLLPSAGLQTNFLLSGKLISSLAQPSGDEEVSTSINGLRSMYFSGILQPQLNFILNDRISFDLNPNVNFSLSPINKETAVRAYQNMFSVGAGLRIKL